MGALTEVSVYDPTNVGDEGDKDRFYQHQQLESIVKACPEGETPLVLWDFNNVVGSLQARYESVIGPHGRGARTNNGSRLLDFARGHSLRWLVPGTSDQITIAGPSISIRILRRLRSIMVLWVLETPKKLQGLPQCSV